MSAMAAATLTSLSLAACALAAEAEAGARPVTVVAAAGPFASVDDAAASASRVDFWDGAPADDDACTECFAALELQRFLPRCVRMPRAGVRLHSGRSLPPSGDVIVLGTRRSNPLVAALDRPGEAAVPPDSPEGFRLRCFRRSGRTVCVVEGGGRVGVLYGAYALLERLGVRFIGLGEQGTCYPRVLGQLPDALDVSESPALVTRGFYAWEPRGTQEFFLWMARNRMNFWTAAEKDVPFLKMLGMRLGIGAHDLQPNFLNPKSRAGGEGSPTYFEAHPEWFGLRGGVRSPNIKGGLGDNFCTSNDDAVAELSRNLVEGLATGIWRYADVVNFWMEDGGKWCECPECQALGTPTDRLLRLVAQVNVEVQKARQAGVIKRPVHLTTLAYAETIDPPTRPLPPSFDYENCSVTFYPIQRCYAHTFEDPLCTETNQRYARALHGWTQGEERHYKGSTFIGEYYNVSNFKSMPVLYTRTMPADIANYYRLGARHLQYMHTPVRLWGTWTLNQWLLARLLWDPSADAPALVREYMAARYPTTHETTTAFYEHLEDAFANITCQKTYLGLHMSTGKPLRFQHLTVMPTPPGANHGPSLQEILASLELADAMLSRSLETCTDATERPRLLEDERRLVYGHAMMRFYSHMVRLVELDQQGDAEGARAEFVGVEREANILRTVPREMVETFICPDGGLEATQCVPTYNALKAKYGAG